MKIALALLLVYAVVGQEPRVTVEHSRDSGQTWNLLGSAAYRDGVFGIAVRDSSGVIVPFLRVSWPVIQCPPMRVGE